MITSNTCLCSYYVLGTLQSGLYTLSHLILQQRYKVSLSVTFFHNNAAWQATTKSQCIQQYVYIARASGISWEAGDVCGGGQMALLIATGSFTCQLVKAGLSWDYQGDSASHQHTSLLSADWSEYILQVLAEGQESKRKEIRKSS